MPSRRASPRLNVLTAATAFTRGSVWSVAQRSAAGADAQRANPFRIDLRMLNEVDRAADVIQTLRGNLHQPWLAAAFSLVGGVGGERDEALLGETLGIQAGGLLFDAPKGCATTTAACLRVASKFAA